MLTLRRFATSSAFLVLVTSCMVEQPHQGRHESAVINGDLDNDDPAVVALMDGNYFFCSGSVVSPHVILTAAHCLEGGPPPSGIFFGTDSNNPSTGVVIDVASAMAHPEYNGNDHDLGVVELADAAPAAPIVRNTTALSNGLAGQDVRVVGFGLSVDDETSNEAGVKLTGLTTFDSIESDYMLATAKDGQSGCYGDSGGPNFMMIGGQEVQAGITSFGTENSCLAGYSGNTDVQKYNDWIDAFITSVEGTAPGPSCNSGDGCLEGCATPDPDCGVDPGPGPGPGPDPGDDDTGDDDSGHASSGGCNAGGDAAGWLLIAGILAIATRTRKERWASPRRLR